MRYLELTHGELFLDGTNYRGSYTQIENLAESIEKHGLLQNLVVKQAPHGWAVVAGARRYLALGQLIKEDRMPADEPIMCLVVDGEPWVPIVENFQRKDVPPWEFGYRLCELYDTGMLMSSIGAQIGCSVGTVSNYIAIAKGLHPDIIELVKKEPQSLTKAQYLAIARTLTEAEEPDLENQIKLLKRFQTIPNGPRRRIVRKPAKMIRARLESLVQGHTRIPAEGQVWIWPVLMYLKGKTDSLQFEVENDE